MTRQQFAAIVFNPFSIMLLGGAAGILDNVLHFFLGKGGDVLFCFVLLAAAAALTPLAREHFAREKQKAALKKKRNLGILEWAVIIPAGVAMAFGLNHLWELAVSHYGPVGNVLFLGCFAAYIVLLLCLDIKQGKADEIKLIAQAA